MSLTRSHRLILALMVLSVLLAACAGSTASTTTAEAHDEHGEGVPFGEPGHAADADRVIDIDANDDFTFGPTDIKVSAGETITFRITNTGSLPHDFTLGDQETQDAHEAEMAEMMENGEMTMHDEANAVALVSGETKDLTWHFTESGTVLIGCHQTGHYEAGMKGAVTVDS